MPAAFDVCVEKGGEVRTMKLKGNKYRRVCVLKGKIILGEVKKRKPV